MCHVSSLSYKLEVGTEAPTLNFSLYVICVQKIPKWILLLQPVIDLFCFWKNVSQIWNTMILIRTLIKRNLPCVFHPMLIKKFVICLIFWFATDKITIEKIFKHFLIGTWHGIHVQWSNVLHFVIGTTFLHKISYIHISIATFVEIM